MNNKVKGRGLPINVVYVADDSRPVDAAAAAAAVAWTGGIMLLSPGAGTATAGADKQIDQLGLTAPSTRSSSSGRTSSTQLPVGPSSSSAWCAALRVLLGLAARTGRANATNTRAAAPCKVAGQRRPGGPSA